MDETGYVKPAAYFHGPPAGWYAISADSELVSASVHRLLRVYDAVRQRARRLQTGDWPHTIEASDCDGRKGL
jgi:hypothetical protein